MDAREFFFRDAGLDSIKALGKMHALWNYLRDYAIPLPSRADLASEQAFYRFIGDFARQYGISQEYLQYAASIASSGAKRAQQKQLALPTPPPPQEKFTGLSQVIDKLYVRSTERPDPRQVRTLKTLHKAVILYHQQFDELKAQFQREDEFQAIYIQFRSRLRAVRFDYYVYTASDAFLEKANFDALRAACLTYDLTEAIRLKGEVHFSNADDLINLAEYLQFGIGYQSPLVREVLRSWQQGFIYTSTDKYVRALCAVTNAKIEELAGRY